MIIDGEKWACEYCVRGHRVKNCRHTGRPLIHINRRGRPFSVCCLCSGPCKAREEHKKFRYSENNDISKKPRARYSRPPADYVPIAPRPAISPVNSTGQKHDLEEKEPGEKMSPSLSSPRLAIPESPPFSASDFQRYSHSEFGNDILDLLLERPSELECSENPTSPMVGFSCLLNSSTLPSVDDQGDLSHLESSNCASEDEMGLRWPCEPLADTSLDGSWLE